MALQCLIHEKPCTPKTTGANVRASNRTLRSLRSERRGGARPIISHPHAADGFTLAHKDKGIRQFWIEHGKACREIGAAMGKALGKTCITNVWIPDGYKDTPADRRLPRERLAASLDAIFKKPIPRKL